MRQIFSAFRFNKKIIGIFAAVWVPTITLCSVVFALQNFFILQEKLTTGRIVAKNAEMGRANVEYEYNASFGTYLPKIGSRGSDYSIVLLFDNYVEEVKVRKADFDGFKKGQKVQVRYVEHLNKITGNATISIQEVQNYLR